MRPVRISTAILAAVFAVGTGPAARSADMMSTCSAEIGNYCAGVPEGRGRMAACLISRSEKLSTPCRTEVQAAATKSRGSILVPASVKKLFDTTYQITLPTACATDADRYCPDVETGDSRVFACLYSHEGLVSKACSSEARSALDGQ